MSFNRTIIFSALSFNRLPKQIKTALPYVIGTASTLTFCYVQKPFRQHHAAMLDFFRSKPASFDIDLSDEYPSNPLDLFMAEPITNRNLLEKTALNSYKERMEVFIMKLQGQFCRTLEQFEEKQNSDVRFQVDRWTRKEGGGGITCIMEDGEVFERAGVNISVVHGKLPVPALEQMKSRGYEFAARNVPLDFFAAAISTVIQPRNPHVPGLHFNFRYFEIVDADGAVHWWYGGGSDLLPYYLNEQEGKYFHQFLKKACDKYDPTYYSKFKKWCDDYFNIKYRDNERLGIGGIFFDDLTESNQESCFQFIKSCADTVIPSYIPIVQNNYQRSYTAGEREWLLLRRGRYAEFMLVLERGTKFGLETPGARIESILMSLPVAARWKYGLNYKENSPEMQYMKVLKQPREWV